VKNTELTNRIFDQVQSAFFEDVAVFSAQQRTMELLPGAPQFDIAADAGAIAARRILSRLYDEEQAAGRVGVAAAE